MKRTSSASWVALGIVVILAAVFALGFVASRESPPVTFGPAQSGIEYGTFWAIGFMGDLIPSGDLRPANSEARYHGEEAARALRATLHFDAAPDYCPSQAAAMRP